MSDNWPEVVVATSLQFAHDQIMLMLRLTLPVVLLVLTSTAALAAVNKYSFTATQDYLAPAHAFSTWAAVLGRHAEQKPALLACAANKKGCPGRLRSYQHMMKKSKALSAQEQISLVHFYINRSQYDKDRVKRVFDHNGKKVGIQRNHWTTLYDFLKRGGDCEDYATSKYFMLRELGFAADDLRIVVTYERRLRGYHAVLAVRQPDDSVWLLDSDNVIRKNSHRGYRFIYAMNEESVWDHRADFTNTLHR